MRLFTAAALVCATLGLGCPSKGTGAHPDAALADAAPTCDGGVVDDAGVCVPDDRCGPYAHENTTGGCTATVTWQSGPDLPTARDHHATAIHAFPGGPFLVVSGGARDSFTDIWDDVLRLRILPDGSLDASPWEQLGSLPTPLSGHTMTFADGYLYLTGGRNSPASRVETYFAAVPASGPLGAWTPTAPLPVAVWHHQAFARDGWLYVIGGQSATDVAESGVRRAPLLPGGGLGSWENLTRLPVPLSHHGVALVGDSVYVVGGLQDAIYSAASWRATFLPDGRLSAWTAQVDMGAGIVTPSVAPIGNAIYSIGGLVGLQFIDLVQRAPLAADGSLGAWVSITDPMPQGRGHVHQAPTRDGRVYLVGGRTGVQPTPGVFASTAAVHIGTFQ